MGKESKGGAPDTFKRINFLYQAAHAALKATPSNLELVRFYANSVKTIARKSVLRLDPSIKRTLCKKCQMLLVPGVTSTIRIKSKRQRHISVRCVECGTTKRFVLNPEHRLWSEQRDAWLSIVPKHVLDQLEERTVTKDTKSVTKESTCSVINSDMDSEDKNSTCKKRKMKNHKNHKNSREHLPVSNGASMDITEDAQVKKVKFSKDHVT